MCLRSLQIALLPSLCPSSSSSPVADRPPIECSLQLAFSERGNAFAEVILSLEGRKIEGGASKRASLSSSVLQTKSERDGRSFDPSGRLLIPRAVRSAPPLRRRRRRRQILLWLLCVGWNDRHAMVPYIEPTHRPISPPASEPENARVGVQSPTASAAERIIIGGRCY